MLRSIFVGLAYGTSTELATIRALTIALGFHQVGDKAFSPCQRWVTWRQTTSHC